MTILNQALKADLRKVSKFWGLKTNSTLTSLCLNRGEMEFYFLSTDKFLKKCVETDNQIGKKEMRVICEIVKTNSSLKSLDLSCD